jgi:hypothetical protein
VQSLELARHLVESSSQSTDFILLADPAAAGEIARRDSSRGLLDSAERSQQSPGDQVEDHDRNQRGREADRQEGPRQRPTRRLCAACAKGSNRMPPYRMPTTPRSGLTIGS